MTLGIHSTGSEESFDREINRVNEERWSIVADFMPQKIFTAAPDGTIDYFNPQWNDFTGLSFEDLSDGGWPQFIHPDDLAEHLQRWQLSIKTGDPFELEHRFRQSDGKYRWHLSRVHAVRDAAGAVTMWIGSCTDIDDLKQAEDEALRHARLATLIADIGVALTLASSLSQMLQRCCDAIVRHLDAALARVWIVDVDHTLELRASSGLYSHLDGEHARIAIGDWKIGRIAESQRPIVTNQVIGDPHIHDQAWAEREGIVAFAGYPLVVHDQVVGVMAVFARHELDQHVQQSLLSISDSIAVGIEWQRVRVEVNRARAEAETQRSRLHGLFMEAPALICILSGPEHVFELANPRYIQMVGGRDIVGKSIRAALPELEGQGYFERLDAVYTTGESDTGNEVQAALDRGRGCPEEVYFNFVYQPIHTDTGDIEGILVHGFDVTDQVLARRQVERLAAEREATLGQIVDGVVIADGEGRVTFINEAGQVLLGRDTLGVPFEGHPETYGLFTTEGIPLRARDTPLTRAIQAEEIVAGMDICVQRPDRNTVTIQVNAAPILSETGSLVGGVATFRDVTLERESERQKVDFLSAAAHDLKTPVTVVQGHAQLLLRRADRGSLTNDQIKSGLALIEDRARVMTGLIDELIDVTRVRMGHSVRLNYSSADLIELVRHAAAGEQRNGTDHRLHIETALVALPGVWDVSRLTRVLQNVLGNASKYSGDDADVTVKVTAEDIEGKLWAVVAVHDHGAGIPEQELHHVFDWFYRATNVRDSVPGTGIGLAGARQFVEQHGGSLTVESEINVGSIFTVRLPVERTPGKSLRVMGQGT